MHDKNMIEKRIIMEVLPFFPGSIRGALLNVDKSVLREIEEIRLRVEKPVMLLYQGKDGLLHKDGQVLASTCEAIQPSLKDLSEIVYNLCENSWYAYQDDINKGFVTIKGGHRIGLVGTPVLDGEKTINVRDISSLNIRIAREVIGCAEKTVKHITKGLRDVYNTLIISAPGMGKTTLLRDMIRQLSNGFSGFLGAKIGLVDERGEIAASCRGIPQNDVGRRTDVIHGALKKTGMEMLLRSMSPNVIALDELGNPSDVTTVLQVINAGIRIIATAHGYDVASLITRQGFRELLHENTFERFVVISVDKNRQYEIKILDGGGNVIAVDNQSGRKYSCDHQFNDGRVCVFPTAY